MTSKKRSGTNKNTFLMHWMPSNAFQGGLWLCSGHKKARWQLYACRTLRLYSDFSDVRQFWHFGTLVVLITITMRQKSVLLFIYVWTSFTVIVSNVFWYTIRNQDDSLFLPLPGIILAKTFLLILLLKLGNIYPLTLLTSVRMDWKCRSGHWRRKSQEWTMQKWTCFFVL